MGKKQLLIVDDSPVIVSRLKSLLEDVPGLRPVRVAGTYAEAIAQLEKDVPDIILLDINLPDRNGIDLLRYVHNRYPAITVIMLSNQGSPFYRNLCTRLGATYFIDKSVEFEQVPLVLGSFL